MVPDFLGEFGRLAINFQPVFSPSFFGKKRNLNDILDRIGSTDVQERCPFNEIPFIRVKLDSYYSGALDRVRYVEYLLHKAFPNPVQARYDRADGFLLG